MEQYLRIGVIANTHGVKGEVKVFPTTDDNRRFLELDELYIDTGKEKRLCHAEGVRFFKNMVILKLQEINDMNDALLYKGKDLLVDREHAVSLEEGEYFICDLIDSVVVTTDGVEYGILTDVLQTAANDVYVVRKPDGKEVLLPVIEDCVKEIDADAKKITVQIMEGLED